MLIKGATGYQGDFISGVPDEWTGRYLGTGDRCFTFSASYLGKIFSSLYVFRLTYSRMRPMAPGKWANVWLLDSPDREMITTCSTLLWHHCCCWQGRHFNSLAPGKFEWKFRYVIFKRILVIDGWGLSSEIALIWMSLDFTEDQSTLVQVMAWCCQATRHYLSQCWPRSLLPYDCH